MIDQSRDALHLSDEALSDRLDNQLERAERQRVDDHLRTCVECATRYAGLQAVRAALQTLRDPDPVPDFRLDPHGVIALPEKPTHAAAEEHTFRGWFAVRLASTVVTFFGIVLIALSLVSGANLPGVSGPPIAAATKTSCPVKVCPNTPQTPVAQATAQPTAQPPGTNDTATSGAIITFTLGSVMALGGLIGVARARPQRRRSR